MTILLAIVALCLCGSTLAQVPSLGVCPQVATQKNFQAHKFLGRWYEAEGFFTNFELGGRCNTVDYSPGSNSSVFNRVDTFISTFSGEVETVRTTVRQTDPEHEPARVVINYHMTPSRVYYNQWIAGTDYDSYAVVYGCTQFGLLRVEFSWLLTRDRHPEPCVIDKAYEVINAEHIDSRNYFKANQQDCDAIDNAGI